MNYIKNMLTEVFTYLVILFLLFLGSFLFSSWMTGYGGLPPIDWASDSIAGEKGSLLETYAIAYYGMLIVLTLNIETRITRWRKKKQKK